MVGSPCAPCPTGGWPLCMPGGPSKGHHTRGSVEGSQFGSRAPWLSKYQRESVWQQSAMALQIYQKQESLHVARAPQLEECNNALGTMPHQIMQLSFVKLRMFLSINTFF